MAYLIPNFMFFICLMTSRLMADQREMDLLRDLLHNYSPQERPVTNYSKPLQVTMKILLQQIIGLEEKKETLSTNVWLQINWNDYKLRWTPEQYNGVVDTRFPSNTVWQPDILLYNSADQNFQGTYPSNLVLYSNGFINWVPPGILRSHCPLDITWFPFDEQLCALKFGSWTYGLNALDLDIDYANVSDKKQAMDTSEYITNGEWDLVSTPAYRIVKDKSCCRPAPYVYLKFYLHIRRRTWYYGFNLIIPSTLISLMTVLGFTLPPDACEKVTLEITILLTVSYLLSVIANETPVTSITVPLIGTFFNCCLLVVSASVVFTVVVLNMHFRTQDTHEITGFIRQVLLVWLPWLVLMRRPGVTFSKKLLYDKEAREEALAHTTREDYNIEEDSSTDSIVNGIKKFDADLDSLSRVGSRELLSAEYAKLATKDEELTKRVNNCIRPLFQKGPQHDPRLGALLLMMQRMVAQMKFITHRLEDEDEFTDVENDWRFAAIAIDRLCLLFFLLFIIVSTCGIMFSAPHLVA